MALSDDLVTCWWEYQRRLRGTPDERRALEAGHPAAVYQRWNDVNARINRGGLPALDLVRSLLARAGTDEAVGLVAAGPLEDLVRKHGNDLVDDIEFLAMQEPVFQHALGLIWLPHGALAPEVQRRLTAPPTRDYAARDYPAGAHRRN